jgi:IS30 family transposase
MRVCEDLQRSAIAERLGMSPKAVKKELERGMRTLRDYLSHLAGTPCDADWKKRIAISAFGLSIEARPAVETHLKERAACRLYDANPRSMAFGT